MSWIDAASLTEALERIRAAAKAAKPGAWLIVAGGWTEEQFAERRRPTQAELAAAAPDNPVYVQLYYRWAMLTPLALRALNIASDADLPSGAKLERDADGNPTGGITGGIREFGAIFAKLPAPSDADQVAGTRKFFREMNRLGVTGIVDAGGVGVTPESYQALFKVWRERELTLRVSYSLSAPAPGEDEMKTFQDLTRLVPAGFGDDMLRFAGIGEIVTWGLYNNDHPTEQQKQQFYEVARWAAGRGMQLRVHWPHDASVGQLLDIFERVDRDVKVAPLHWIVDHLDDASVASLARVKALGVGWAFQDAMYFAGDRYAKAAGLDAARRAPPLATGLHMGVIMGAGTDALAEEELAEALGRYFGHAIDVPRYWRDFLGHPDRGLACGRRQRGAERARRAGEDERFDCGGDGFLQKRQRAEDIDIDEIPLAMRGDVRLVQGSPRG